MTAVVIADVDGPLATRPLAQGLVNRLRRVGIEVDGALVVGCRARDGLGEVARWRMVVDHSAGHRIALMDLAGALRELCRLADDRAARRLTAAGLGELAHGGESGALLDRWIELLDVPVAT